VLTWNPRQSTLKETVTLPTGYHVGELPDERDVGGDIAWTKGSWSDNGRKATYEQVWHVSERMVPAESYEELKESIDALQDHDTITLALEQKGGAR
jgi:outer membrane receptor for ferric coprogen and ferric-rhodotorulic acid